MAQTVEEIQQRLIALKCPSEVVEKHVGRLRQLQRRRIKRHRVVEIKGRWGTRLKLVEG